MTPMKSRLAFWLFLSLAMAPALYAAIKPNALGTLAPILCLHLFGLGILCLLYYLFRQKAVGRVFWAIGFSSSCLGTFGLLYLLVYFVLPLARFLSSRTLAIHAISVLAYGGITVLLFFMRPRTLSATPPTWLISTLGVLLFNGLCILIAPPTG